MKNQILNSISFEFAKTKKLGLKAIEQIPEVHLSEVLFGETSVAVIVRHLNGNMKSRWQNFLTEDGEKKWRNRDSEFEISQTNKKELLTLYIEGWKELEKALSELNDEMLTQYVTIRGEKLTVLQALNRQVSHYSYHIGQIVILAKMMLGEKFNTLSIPKNKSK